MANLIVFLASLPFLYRRLLSYMRYFQQEEYQGSRYVKWIVVARAFDTKATTVLLLCAFGSLFFDFSYLLAAVALIVLAMLEPNPQKVGKVRLKLTDRAKNILNVSVLLAFLALTIAYPYGLIGLITVVQMTPLFLIGANLILLPFEKRKQNRFLEKAKEIISQNAPYVIGITGSYGKTSTKEALARILQVTLGPTFWPPKSFNTLMGITREIRQRLVKGYKYAIIEMGAYQRGSIKNVCELTPPQAAIITGVGMCHLDRFGSLDAIRLAKSELAEALPSSGILVCNGDNEGACWIAKNCTRAKTYLYGFDRSDFDCSVSDLRFSEAGTSFTLHWQGKSYEGKTPLVGKTALSNVIASFTMACALGANPEFVLATIATLEPVANRLQIKKEGEVLYVHDAYNSNSVGFTSALEVMKELSGKRRIVMTPGMIELGERQEHENYEVAKLAGSCCDIALVVGKTNRQALMRGFIDGGVNPSNVHMCDTREHAFDMIADLRQKEDIILIENDLTDIYETTHSF